MGVEGTLRLLGDALAEPAEKRYRSEAWFQAYMAALFEVDRKQLAEKIELAKRLIHRREIQVFSQRLSPDERNALNRAFHALQALQICHKP